MGRSTACASCASTPTARGIESAIEQPYGIRDLRDAVGRRVRADRLIRTDKGIGIGEFGFAEVIATAAQAARGTRAIGDPREVDFEGRPAYEFRLRDAVPPRERSGRPTSSRSRCGSSVSAAAHRPRAGARGPSAGAPSACRPSSTCPTTLAVGRCSTCVSVVSRYLTPRGWRGMAQASRRRAAARRPGLPDPQASRRGNGSSNGSLAARRSGVRAARPPGLVQSDRQPTGHGDSREIICGRSRR
jgi:hypothetical protein